MRSITHVWYFLFQEVEEAIKGLSPVMFEDFIKPSLINKEVLYLITYPYFRTSIREKVEF